MVRGYSVTIGKIVQHTPYRLIVRIIVRMKLLVIHTNEAPRPIVGLSDIRHGKLCRINYPFANGAYVMIQVYFPVLIQMEVDFPAYVAQRGRAARPYPRPPAQSSALPSRESNRTPLRMYLESGLEGV